jgi:hypothetical protein
MSEIGKLFVTIGSKFEASGFDKAIDKIKTFGVITSIFTAAILITKKFIDESSKAETAMINLASAMKTAGIYTEEGYRSTLKYAEALQKTTAYSNEEINAAQTMLISYGVTTEKLGSVTQATLDFASAKGIDLASAANLVARSIGTENNALNRYGIEVDKGLDKTGRMTEVVNGIERLFGGRAANSTNAFAGKMKLLNIYIGEVFETIGLRLLPIFNMLIGIILTALIPAVDALPNKLDKAKTAFDGVATLLKWIISAAVGVVASFDLMGNVLAQFMLNTLGFTQAAKLGWEELKIKIMEYGTIMQGILSQQVVNLDSVIANMKNNVTEMGVSLNDTVKRFADTMAANQQLVQGFMNSMASSFSGSIANMMNGTLNFRNGVKAVWNDLKNYVIQQIALMIAKWLTFQLITGFFGGTAGTSILGKILKFDSGGIIPGPIGAPKLILAHAGETVLPTHKSGSNSFSNNITVNVNSVNSRQEARRMGDIIGNAILNKVNKNVIK